MKTLFEKNLIENDFPQPKTRTNHGDLKGSFTCLGNWYNLFDPISMEQCENILKKVSPVDRKMGLKEIEAAKKNVKYWKPKPHLDFLYKKFESENPNFYKN